MVVVGSRGRGTVRSLLLGSVGVALTRHAACPGRGPPSRPTRGVVRHGVVVGADGSTRCRCATLEFAYRQASLRDLPADRRALLLGRAQERGDTLSSSPPSAADRSRRRGCSWPSPWPGPGEKFPDVRVRTELARGLADQALAAAAVSGWT